MKSRTTGNVPDRHGVSLHGRSYDLFVLLLTLFSLAVVALLLFFPTVVMFLPNLLG